MHAQHYSSNAVVVSTVDGPLLSYEAVLMVQLELIPGRQAYCRGQVEALHWRSEDGVEGCGGRGQEGRGQEGPCCYH